MQADRRLDGDDFTQIITLLRNNGYDVESIRKDTEWLEDKDAYVRTPRIGITICKIKDKDIG